MTLRIPAKVLLHVCSYDFYDMTLSTGKQRRDMMNGFSAVVHFSTSSVRMSEGTFCRVAVQVKNEI